MQSESSPQVPATSPASALVPVAPARKSFWRRIAYAAFTLAGLAFIAFGIYYFYPVAGNGDASQGGDPKKDTAPSPYFVGWPKPDLVIIVTGQMHGYIQPCGCSFPQYGGLARRYNFIESLRAKGWPVVALDVGEIPQTHGPQTMLKYITSMKALKLMGYSAVGLGKYEFNMPLFQGLANTSLNDPLPTPIASSLKNVKKGQENYDMNVREFKVIDNVSPRIGVVSVVDKSIQDQVTDPACKFPAPPAQALAAALKEARVNKAEVSVLLYQGTDSQQEVGKLLADLAVLRAANKAIPPLRIILSLSNESEPPGRAKDINGAQVITVGHKGRYVGVIGLFRQNNNFQFRYELVPIGPQFDTPPGTKNPVMGLMEEYAAKVRDGDYLHRFPRSQHSLQVQVDEMKLETKYVGSDKCANCHQHAYDVWKNSKGELSSKGHTKMHSRAFTSLVEDKNPSLRQFDGECVVCHTVGFANSGGYAAKDNPAKLDKNLEHVGCESCHGPASAHFNNPDNVRLRELINPLSTNPKHMPPSVKGVPALATAWVEKQRLKQDGFCQKCHDSENDVHWGDKPYLKKWENIDHMTPPVAGANANKGNPIVATPPAQKGAIVPPVVEKGPSPGIRIDTDIKPGDEK